MKVVVACEFSGIVREAFALRGHDAWSVDLQSSELPGKHIQADIRSVDLRPFDLMIAHPPCTHLAVSGARHFYRKPFLQREALDFVRFLMDAPVSMIAIENPVGVISTRIRKPDQIVQPYHFGDEATKATCLWLKHLPKLVPTNIVGKGDRVYFPSGKSLPAWYTKSSQREKVRNRTFQGIADAMAEQWGSIPILPRRQVVNK